MGKHFKEENGFTLVEALITLVITTIILIALVQIFSGSDRFFRYSVSQSQNAMTVQNVLATIVSELKYIETLTIPAVGGSGPQTRYTTLSGISGRIYLDANDVVFENDNVEVKRLADGQIQRLIFERDSIEPQKMTITLITRSNLDSNSQPLTVSTRVMMLNL